MSFSIAHFFRPPFLHAHDIKYLETCLKRAECETSAELRVCIEKHCAQDVCERAREVFGKLAMHETREHNAVLVYLAYKDRKLAIWADEGIYQYVDKNFWQDTISRASALLRQRQKKEALALCINDIGQKLAQYFPYDKDGDTNELSDEIVFGV